MSLQIRDNATINHNWLSDIARHAGAPVADKARADLYSVQDAMVDTTAAAPDATEMFKEQFGDIAQNKEQFHAVMKQVYGDKYDVATAESLRQKALAGDYSFLPPVKFVSRESLSGANGAYNSAEGVVYLAEDLKSNPELMKSTFVEEAGHHLDTLLNTGDSMGDEGELFRRTLAGEKLTASDIAAIRGENDKGTITVDGKQVEVEFWNPVKSIKNAAKKVGGAIKDAAKAVAGAAKDAAGAVYDGAKTVVGKTMDALMWAGGKLGDGFWKIMEGGVWVAGKMREGVVLAGSELKKIGKSFVQVGRFVRDKVGGFLYDAGKSFLQVGRYVRDKVGGFLYDAGKSFVQLGRFVRDKVGGFVVNVGESFLQAGRYIRNKIGGMFVD